LKSGKTIPLRGARAALPEAAEPNGNAELQGIQSVETGFQVLDVLARADAALTLGEISRRTELSLSQARRYLVSLVRCGLAKQDADTGRYNLGSRSLQIGLAALARVDAVELATAELKQLVGRIHEQGTLAVWGDEGPTIVRWIRGGGGMRVTSAGLGAIFPLLTSATGLVFLTYLPEDSTREQLQRELRTNDLSQPDIRARLDGIRAKVRDTGHGWLKGHFVEGIRGAAAPIFDSQQELVAVMAIAGTERRTADGNDPSVVGLMEAAAQVSRELCSPMPRPGA
jgi:DNA-binding IclR family transcriptional regulator